MTKFKHILFPTDFSDVSAKAAKDALQLAKSLEATLHFIHVIELDAFVGVYGRAITTLPDIGDRLQKDSEKELAQFVAQFEGTQGVSLKQDVLIGSAADTICDYAAKKKIDLIAIPTHGRRGFQRFILGSVAERVVRLAPCPVLVLRLSN